MNAVRSVARRLTVTAAIIALSTGALAGTAAADTTAAGSPAESSAAAPVDTIVQVDQKVAAAAGQELRMLLCIVCWFPGH